MVKQSLRTRRFIAKYMDYLTYFGFFFVAMIGVGVAVTWFVKVDDVVNTTGTIIPHEQALKHTQEAVVLKVLVPNHAEVTENEDLIWICDDPNWVARFRTEEPQDPDRIAVIRREIPSQLVIVLPAPISGVVVVGESLEGKVIAAGSVIAKVIDFNDLRIAANASGNSVVLVRKGQEVKVEPLAHYGNKVILRGDIDYPGWWGKGQAQFNTAGDGKIKEILKRHFEGTRVGLEDEEDTVFKFTEVKSVDLEGIMRVAESNQGQDEEAIEAEPFVGTLVTGTVFEALHKASVNIRNLPDSVRTEIKDLLQDRFKAGVQLPESALSRVDDLRSRIDEGSFLDSLRAGLRGDNKVVLSVLQIEDLEITVAMDVVQSEAEKADGNADGNDKDAERVVLESKTRDCSIVVKLVNPPPPALRAKVRALALGAPPVYITATLKIVVDQRRIAMLLFRKN